MSWSNVQESLARALVRAVEETRNPGAVAYVGNLERTLFRQAIGMRQLEPAAHPAEPDTLYDLASLTKTVATTTAILLLYEDGELDLDAPVTEFLPIEAYSNITLRHLLTHSAGLVAGGAYFREVSSTSEMIERFAKRDLDWPPGARRRYSDVGFILLGQIVELAAKDSLDAFCRERIFEPLHMEDTAFNPPKQLAARAAATERCGWRGRVMVGQVHDENAYAVGGVSGHAGLFSTADDLARYCRGLLEGALLRESTIEEMIRPGQVPTYPWQGLGWQVAPWESGAQGYLPSRRAFGHSGWTGVSLWIDPDPGVFSILLGNTCHPSRSDRQNRAFRGIFHAAAAKCLYPVRSAAHTGLDRLLLDEFAPLKDRRFALLTNHASVDAWGRHIIKLLDLDSSLQLKRLYSPEHGIRGQAEAGEDVASESGPIPVTSLYGDRKRPTDEELDEIDVLVVDLQDVGSRYYTYMATMKECMAACADKGIPLLVLDRPNPIGGAVLEGPIATNTDTPVSCAAIPVRHAMTMGELALYFAAHEFERPRPSVQVYPLDNWRRDLYFNDLSLPWAPPSPNIPSAETALLYVGTCLFEGTNLNEGRGTDTPFHVLGAPWLDAVAVLRQIAPEESQGAVLEPITYTPVSMPGRASNPRYQDEVCRGVRIRIRDRMALRPFTLALALIQAIRNRHADQFEWTGMFDLLAGGPALRDELEAGDAALTIVNRWAVAHEEFRQRIPSRYE